MEPGTLTIDFGGELRVLTPADESLTFGRSADLVIDSDMRLHRVLGRFVHRDGTWWVENLGGSIHLLIAVRDTGSTADLAPGAIHSLTGLVTDLSFRVGESNFQLTLSQSSSITVTPLPPHDTIYPALPDLNEEQLDLVVALARPRLLNPTSVAIPSTKETAQLLGWKTTKVNRKFDYLYNRIESLGHPSFERLREHSHDRRAAVVQLAMEQRWATRDQLTERGWS